MRLLMCPPDHFSVVYEINPWMHREVTVDSELAGAQWRGLEQTLRGLGCQIELVEPVEGLPDMVFTANAGIVRGGVAVPSNFRHAQRQAEREHFARWFSEHGFRLAELPQGIDHEGEGDALWVGRRLFSAYWFRSDVRAHNLLSLILEAPVLAVELSDPRFYHLDTCFCPLDAETVMWWPEAFDPYARRLVEAAVPNRLAVSEEDALAFCCNAVVVGRTVVMNAAGAMGPELEALGFDVVETPLSEFMKAGGAAKCLVLELDRDAAEQPRERSGA